MFRLPFHIARRHSNWSNKITQRKQVWIQLRTLAVSRYGSKDDFEPGMKEDDGAVGVDLSPEDIELYQYNPNVIADKPKNIEETTEEREKRKQKFRDELALRTGRGWSDPWEITDEDCADLTELDDMQDWTPDFASKFSLDRVKVVGIPTLKEMYDLALPLPPPPRPNSDKKAYASHRKELHYDYIRSKVSVIVEPKIDGIKKLNSWEEKQDAVDELFESVEFQLKEEEEVLGRQHNFGALVEKAVQDHLESLQKDETTQQSENDDATQSSPPPPSSDEEKEVLPPFMDLYNKKDIPEGEAVGPVVPKILHPLKPNERSHGVGRMVEEWELSAHDETKRIMLRESTQKIARIIDNNVSSRILLNGDTGCGKSATLCSIVASARTSGHIVLYAPDGDRLRKHGYYISPNSKIPGLFDIPLLSKEMCENLLESHEADLEGFVASATTRDKFLDDKLKKDMPDADELSLVGLLRLGAQDEALASMAYSVVVETLMNQEDKPFLVVLDEFNCYYDYGHYYHMDYDEETNESIPLTQISLFEPLLASMGLSQGAEEKEGHRAVIKRGGIVAAISENRAVARKFTDGLLELAMEQEVAAQVDEIPPMHVVTIPRFSKLEVEHILSNFDVIGIGRLRFDKGDTVIDEQEVSFLRMISGSNGQQLLDACIE